MEKTSATTTISSISESEAQRAVRTRDASYDGKLFFAVITTGIFCRPSCRSRQAKPENLRFYESVESAKNAGFRACKRCTPESLGKENNKMVTVARYIEEHAEDKLTLAMLSKMFELSPSYLQKAFKATIGLSPKAFQEGVRQNQFKSLLSNGESVTDAVYATGYGSSNRVYENAMSNLGMTPGAYKAGAKGEVINYICKKSKFGHLMLAATEKGVCFVMFGPSDAELKSKLDDEFPKAQTKRAKNSKQLVLWFEAIDAYLNENKCMPTIPLDIRGTAFQLRVWEFLQSIEEGKTVSYAGVACGIRQPNAFRASATACAKNRIALLIPCHRVLRGDGSVGGYRWGVDTKEALLLIENSAERG
ncbi:UNVERIFIED_CONTAM: hypothetical protein GTU68_066056 [Idotea baltica]|nr:hypothetical protein [Idotea baltica]